MEMEMEIRMDMEIKPCWRWTGDGGKRSLRGGHSNNKLADFPRRFFAAMDDTSAADATLLTHTHTHTHTPPHDASHCARGIAEHTEGQEEERERGESGEPSM